MASVVLQNGHWIDARNEKAGRERWTASLSDQARGEGALLARALRISLARSSKFSNLQRSILGPAAPTLGLCVITSGFSSSAWKSQRS